MAFAPLTSRFRLREKIAVAFSIVVGIVALFIHSYFPEELADQLFAAAREKTQSIAKTTAFSVGAALFVEDTTAAREAFTNARQDTNIVFAVLTNASGSIFCAYNLDEANHYNSQRTEHLQPNRSDLDILAITTPVTHKDRVIGQLQIGMSLSSLRAQIRQTRLTILLVSLLVFIGGVIIVYYLTTVFTGQLRQMAVTAGRIAEGDLTQRASVQTRDELGQLASVFNEMVANLASTQRHLQNISVDLERRVEERTEQLTRSENALRQSGAQLHALSTRLQKVREEERTLLARDIHDVLGQMLTAINIDIAMVERNLQKAEPSAPVNQAIEKMHTLSELVEVTINNVRRLSLELRPDILDSRGLVAALEWQAQEFQTRTGVECKMDMHTEVQDLDQQRSIALFRIFQESLANIARHAQATRVEIRLEEANGNLVLQITDNGKGIKQSDILNIESLGILGMRERTLSLGGELSIVGKTGLGTTVRADIPLKRDGSD